MRTDVSIPMADGDAERRRRELIALFDRTLR